MFDDYLATHPNKSVDSGLLRLQAKDERNVSGSIGTCGMKEPGSPVRVLGHALDITDRILVSVRQAKPERLGKGA